MAVRMKISKSQEASEIVCARTLACLPVSEQVLRLREGKRSEWLWGKMLRRILCRVRLYASVGLAPSGFRRCLFDAELLEPQYLFCTLQCGAFVMRRDLRVANPRRTVNIIDLLILLRLHYCRSRI